MVRQKEAVEAVGMLLSCSKPLLRLLETTVTSLRAAMHDCKVLMLWTVVMSTNDSFKTLKERWRRRGPLTATVP